MSRAVIIKKNERGLFNIFDKESGEELAGVIKTEIISNPQPPVVVIVTFAATGFNGFDIDLSVFNENT